MVRVGRLVDGYIIFDGCLKDGGSLDNQLIPDTLRKSFEIASPLHGKLQCFLQGSQSP